MPANDVSGRPATANITDDDGQETRITVVIPCYQADRTVIRAVDSALSQCDGKVSIVVVIDDGSETTLGLVKQLGDPRIRTVMNERNLGAPASRNRGLELAATPFVSFLDADDFYEGDFLAPLIALMEREDSDVGFGPSVYWNERDGYTYRYVPDYKDRSDVFYRWFSGMRSVNTCSVAWRSSYLRKIGGWDESIKRNQDGELAMRAILLGAKFSMSAVGAGVWFNDTAVPSISTRTDNLSVLFDVVSKFQAMRSDFVPDSLRIEACARHLHLIAHAAYRAGADEVGVEAMRRRRALGFSDHQGDTRHRISVALRIVPPRIRAGLWRVAMGLKRRSALREEISASP